MEYYKGKELHHFGLLPDMVAHRHEDRTAFFFRDEKQTFNELKEHSNKFASSLVDEGIEPGERICMYMPNELIFPEIFFGIIKAGAIPVPLNLRLPPRTLKYCIENSEATTLVASSLETNIASPEMAKKLAKDAEIGRVIIPGESEEGIIDYSDLVQQGDPDFEIVPRDYQDFTVHLYTSGTTGKPKGVPLTHENVLTCIEGYTQIATARADTRILHVLPLYHVYGLTAVLGVLLWAGGSIVFQAEPDPDLILKNIDKYECTGFTGVPALFRMIWLVYDNNPEDYDLSSLEDVVCAAAPLDEETRRTIMQEWKVRFSEGSGMTETSPAGPFHLGDIPKAAGCIGWPHPGLDMKIVDPQTRETIVPWEEIAPWGILKEEHYNAEGEAAVRGPTVFKGYWKMPEKNKEIFDEEGWFYTGDIMRIDEDKAFWMVERTDDMILSGGENIYPSMVEEALMEHPGVADVAVVGAPHRTKGKVPVAFVVSRPGVELTEDELKEFSLERVATYAHPRRVFFVDSLPKSGTLKTQHFKLEEEAKEKLKEPLG